MARSGRFRVARRGERGVFSADWLLVIAAVMGLGGLSAYLVEDYLESLTTERTAEQRDTAAYLDDGRTLNTEHRVIRHAAAAAANIVDEAVSVEPGDPRFPTWGDWARHFDAKCRRLPLSYSHMDDFTVSSLFLPPLRSANHRYYSKDRGAASDPLWDTTDPSVAAAVTAALRDADTTPYANDGTAGYPIHYVQQRTDPTVSALLLLSMRKELAPDTEGNVTRGMAAFDLRDPQNPNQKILVTADDVKRSLFTGAVAWCFLPRSVSATLPDGTLDDNNLLLQAARNYARGVAANAKVDDPERPGDPDKPGTWQNWQDHWTERCLETLDVFSDLKGFSVKAEFTKPRQSDVNELISDPNRGEQNYKSPKTLSNVQASVCEVEAA